MMTRRTPLYDEHIRLKAKMVDFAGWEMPVQYTGVIVEHLAVRSSAGLFDVSHMGQIEIAGPDAEDLIQYLTTNDIRKVGDGRAQYTLLCNDLGTVIDDVIAYRFDARRYILVVNASNIEKDFAWCRARARGNADVKNISDSFAMIAFQGPRALGILAKLTDIDLGAIPTYHFKLGSVAGRGSCIIAKTGYTGEEGVEIFIPPADASAVWRALLESGKSCGICAAGLGARDTLRMEMKYSLYGHEISEETTPIEAGLSWAVKLEVEDEFIGKEAIRAFKEKGATRKLVGFKMLDRGIPRQGYGITTDGRGNGIVTSGTMSPSLGYAIGIGFVPIECSGVGTHIYIDIRGQPRKADVVKTPFYKK